MSVIAFLKTVFCKRSLLMTANSKPQGGTITIPSLIEFIELVIYAILTLAAAAGPLDGLVAWHSMNLPYIGQVQNIGQVQMQVPLFGLVFAVAVALFVYIGRRRPEIIHQPRWAMLFTLYVTAVVHASTAYDLPAKYPFSPLCSLFYAVLIIFGATGRAKIYITVFILMLIGELIPVGRFFFTNLQSQPDGIFQSVSYQLGEMLPSFFLMGASGLCTLFMAPFRVIVKKVETSEKQGPAAKKATRETGMFTVDRGETASMDYDPNKSGVYSIDEGEFQKMRDLTVSDELRSLVYFMYKNFSVHSAICFIYDAQQRVFTINSAETHSPGSIKSNVRIPAGRGVVGNIAVEGRSFVSGDIMQYNVGLGYYSQPESIYSILAVPIINYDEHHQPKELLGALVVDSKDKLAFRDNHRDTMNRFALIAAALITNIRGRLYQQRAAGQFQIFYEAGRHFVDVHKAEDVLDTLFSMIISVTPFTRVVQIESHAETGMYTLRKIAGNPAELKEGMTFPMNEGLYSTALKTRNIVYFANYEAQKAHPTGQSLYRFMPEEPPNPDIRSFMIIPLVAGGEDATASCLISVENATPNMYQSEAGKIIATLVSNAAVAYQKALLYHKMELLATTDGLTGLCNHRTFQENLHKEIIRAHRYQHPLSLLLLDIDHFKKFNDTYGHQIGDLVLQEVANCLRKVVREHDIAARYGGEEFVVIIPETASAAAASIADRIRKTIETHAVFTEGKELTITVSIGCATIPEHAGLQAELIEKSDKAMYFSKKNGRNRVTIYSKEMG